MSQKPHIYCLGGTNIDLKLTPLQPLVASTSNPIRSYCSFGGVARNVVANLAGWTDQLHFQTIVGQDADGERALQELELAGVDVQDAIISPLFRTAHYYAVQELSGELQIAYADMEIYDHINPEQFTDSWKRWQPNSLIFIDTNLPQTLLTALLSQMKQHQICIDPVSVSKAKKLPDNLTHLFLLKPNLLEASALTGLTLCSIADCMRAGRLLLNRGVQNVVISLGQEGYVMVNDTLEEHQISPKIERIIDANGAGDTFMAGILFGFQQGLTLVEACEIGAEAAAATLKTRENTGNHFNPHLFLADREQVQEEIRHATII